MNDIIADEITADEITADEIAQNYSAMSASVTLINTLAGETDSYTDTLGDLQRNVDHLVDMRSESYWTTEDFTAVDAAIATANARIASVNANGVERPTYETSASAKKAVNGWIDRLLSQITSQYPRHEIDSWSTKGEAARAVVAGTARADQTLLVQSEADIVSATLADQAALIVTKADQFAAIISLTSGLRQKTGTALDAATTPEQFAAIVDAALVEASASAAAHGLTV
jgi:hypothetical protein